MKRCEKHCNATWTACYRKHGLKPGPDYGDNPLPEAVTCNHAQSHCVKNATNMNARTAKLSHSGPSRMLHGGFLLCWWWLLSSCTCARGGGVDAPPLKGQSPQGESGRLFLSTTVLDCHRLRVSTSRCCWMSTQPHQVLPSSKVLVSLWQTRA